MIKHIVILAVDCLFLLFLGIILAIIVTGGFSFALGSLEIQAHSLRNPCIFLICVLILRRFLAGSFFHEFLGLDLLKRFSHSLTRHFTESRRFRNWVIIGFFVLLIITAVSVVSNPLQSGLTGYYYDNPDWSGSPKTVTTDRFFDLHRMKREFPFLVENYSIQWTGVIFISMAGEYQFATISDDGSELSLDDQLVVDNRGLHGLVEQTGRIRLEKGFHPITIRYMQGGGGAEFNVYWTPPGGNRKLLSDAPLFLEEPTNVFHSQIYQVRKIVLPLLVIFWCLLIAIGSIAPISNHIAKNPQVWKVSPLTLKLFGFFLIGVLAVNIILSALADKTTVNDSTIFQNISNFRNNTTLYYTHFFLFFPKHGYGDSWKHMYNALTYFNNPAEKSRYSELFFDKHVKFIYPPTSLLLFKPFMRFSIARVITTANLLSWLMIIVSAFLIEHMFSLSLQRYSGTDNVSVGERIVRMVLMLCITLTFYPIVRSFRLGQVQTWLYFFFVLAMWVWMLGKKGLSGVFIGLICIFKPQLGLLAIWGLLRKQWRFAIAIIVTSGVVGLMSLYVFGLANHLDYLHVLSYISRHGESFHPNQSINGFLHRLFFNGTNLTWDAYFYPPYHPVIHAGTVLSSLLLIAAALFWKYKQHHREDILDLSIASLSFTMASPLAWEHHYSFLLPMFVFALPATLASKFKRSGVILMFVAFVLSCNYYQFTGHFASTRLNFLQSYLLFGAILFLVYLYMLRNAHSEARPDYS